MDKLTTILLFLGASQAVDSHLKGDILDMLRQESPLNKKIIEKTLTETADVPQQDAQLQLEGKAISAEQSAEQAKSI